VVSTDPRRPEIPGRGSRRAAYHAWLPRPIARAADDLGYFSVMLRTGRSSEESRVVASAMVQVTARLRFLGRFGFDRGEPRRIAANPDSAVGGRGSCQAVAGGDPSEMHGDGVRFAHGERYKATAEYLTVWRAPMPGKLSIVTRDHCWRGTLKTPLSVSSKAPSAVGSSGAGQVAARTREYRELGIDRFILSAIRIWKSAIASRNSSFRCCLSEVGDRTSPRPGTECGSVRRSSQIRLRRGG
jgi:hypothetical protein